MNEITRHGSIRAPARRIVSLAPSITEILFYLGMGESVVGVTRNCDYPAPANNLSKIGSFATPVVKTILELSPDVVIGLRDLHQYLAESVVSAKTGLMLLQYNDVPGVLDAMEAIASLAEDTRAGRERIALLRERTRKLELARTRHRGIRSCFVTFDDPIIIPGHGSYQYDALRMAGAIPMSDNTTQYESVTLEKVRHFNPEIIFACGRHRDEPPRTRCPECQATNPVCQRIVDDIAIKPGWKETSASITGHVIPMPCAWLCRPGPRLIDGIEAIARIFQGKYIIAGE